MSSGVLTVQTSSTFPARCAWRMNRFVTIVVLFDDSGT